MSDDVGSWSPGDDGLPSTTQLSRAAALWMEAGEDALEALAASSSELAAPLRMAMHHGRGSLDAALDALATAELEALVQLFTRLEAKPGFEAGDRSPVIPIMRLLKQRLDSEAHGALVQWVRAHTENRFLPHGSLQDRLRG